MFVNRLTTDKVLSAASAKLNEVLTKYRGQDFLFLSSGGSSLALLDKIDVANFGNWSTVTVLDERFSVDPTVNNFSIIQNTNFYAEIKKRGVKFIETKVLEGNDAGSDNSQTDTVQALGDRFNTQLKHWLKAHPKGSIIATIGIGTDGHIGGIMPHADDPIFFETTFNNPNILAVGYDAKNKNPYSLRATVTLPMFRKITSAIVYAVGENKREPFTRLFSETGSLAETPCRILKEMKNVEVFTDVVM